MRLKAGIKRDGTLTAFEFSVLGTPGAYAAGGYQGGRCLGEGPLPLS